MMAPYLTKKFDVQNGLRVVFPQLQISVGKSDAGAWVVLAPSTKSFLKDCAWCQGMAWWVELFSSTQLLGSGRWPKLTASLFHAFI